MALFTLCLLPCLSSATNIATFTDDSCQDSYRSLNGPNGYPNGTCTRLDSEGPFKSFQVVEEDNGCAVTIYGADSTEDPCSSLALDLAGVAQCYNASWVYYSIDECIAPLLTSASSSSALSSTSSVSVASPTSNLPSSASVRSKTVQSAGVTTATTVVTASSQPTSTSSGAKPVGPIVGGVVGGVAALALIGLLAFVVHRRHERKPEPPHEAPSENIHEVTGYSHALELPSTDKRVELATMRERAELESLNSGRHPGIPNTMPAELDGRKYD